jgi:predicted nucleotidyltransferase
MTPSSDTSASAPAIAFAGEVARLWERELADELLGFYLIGSLAHGGFCERYSDIDVALIAARPLQGDALDRVAQEAAALSPALARKLSLFWTDETFSAGRFPPLDRLDYLDHALPLIERRRVEPPRPSRAEVRAYLAGEPFQNWTQQVSRLSALAALSRDDHKRYLRAILYPARFVYSWETGTMRSNDEAVKFLQGRADGLDLDLIARALDCRNRGADALPLFAERGKLTGLLDACRRLVAAPGG